MEQDSSQSTEKQNDQNSEIQVQIFLHEYLRDQKLFPMNQISIQILNDNANSYKDNADKQYLDQFIGQQEFKPEFKQNSQVEEVKEGIPSQQEKTKMFDIQIGKRNLFLSYHSGFEINLSNQDMFYPCFQIVNLVLDDIKFSQGSDSKLLVSSNIPLFKPNMNYQDMQQLITYIGLPLQKLMFIEYYTGTKIQKFIQNYFDEIFAEEEEFSMIKQQHQFVNNNQEQLQNHESLNFSIGSTTYDSQHISQSDKESQPLKQNLQANEKQKDDSQLYEDLEDYCKKMKKNVQKIKNLTEQQLKSQISPQQQKEIQ